MDRDVVRINNEILLSHKKEQNNAICNNMHGPIDYHILRELSGREIKYHIISLICGI